MNILKRSDNMTENEKILIFEYFNNYQSRLENSVDVWDLRATRRNLDCIDHLEEIIAKERLKMFKSVRDDILLLLKLSP